ncbi:hypothetical protein [Brevibacillus parabrevis]|uniref:hypothetical protein n=1 Tax=Brevibacillus parabrevis TaxID=54914 RepID=UPI0028D66DB5|nr:hypothetical protein [Brevibacillus parabrevis]
MKKLLSITLAALVALAAFGVGSGEIVSAKQKVELSKQEEKEMKRKLKDLGINEKTQDKLLEKYKNGYIWDSMNPEVLSQLPEDALEISAKNPVKTYTFQDGSVLKLEAKVVEKTVENNRGISPLSTSQCGSGYCKYFEVLVDGSSGVQSAEFYADIVLVNGGYDYISNVYDDSIVVIGGSYSNDSLKIERQKETSNQEAYARLKWNTTAIGGAGGATSYLRLYVGDDDWRITASM